MSTFRFPKEKREAILQRQEEAKEQQQSLQMIGPKVFSFKPDVKYYIVPLPSPEGNLAISVSFHFNMGKVMGLQKEGDGGYFPPCPRNTFLELPERKVLGKCPICEVYWRYYEAFREAQSNQDKAKQLLYGDLRKLLSAFPRYWMYAVVIEKDSLDQGVPLITKSDVMRIQIPKTIYAPLMETWFAPMGQVFEDYVDALTAKEIDPTGSIFDHMVETGRAFCFTAKRSKEGGQGYKTGWALKEVELDENILEGLPELVEIYKHMRSSSPEFTKYDVLQAVVNKELHMRQAPGFEQVDIEKERLQIKDPVISAEVDTSSSEHVDEEDSIIASEHVTEEDPVIDSKEEVSDVRKKIREAAKLQRKAREDSMLQKSADEEAGL